MELMLDLKPSTQPTSLFSARTAQRIDWQRVNPTWRGIQKAEEWARPKVLEAVKEFRLAARFQLVKSLYRNPDKGKKDLDRAARTGILVRHDLVTEKGNVPLLTLGPLGARLIGDRFVPNWWVDIPLAEVLKRLVVVQLVLRLREAGECHLFNARSPLSAIVVFNNLDYGVLVVRQDVEEVMENLLFLQARRLLMVTEDLEQAGILAGELGDRGRFATDLELMRSPLVFYRWDGGFVTDKVFKLPGAGRVKF
ncbi:MAG: hypothetical protein D9V47_11935 [Clostridia bacterium]|nr:MAG: hypothetical protein D9V47_11935 [Clostridia bacterium]